MGIGLNFSVNVSMTAGAVKTAGIQIAMGDPAGARLDTEAVSVANLSLVAGTNAVGRDEPPSLFADGGLMHESALPGPTLFVGEQPIYHTLGSSAALLEGFVPEIPAPTDAIWFAVASDFPDVQQARADFDASGVEAIQLDVSALLAEGERRRKRVKVTPGKAGGLFIGAPRRGCS